MNRSQLTQIAPLMGLARADTFLIPLERAMTRWDINTLNCQASFLAQVIYESQNLAVMSENLNYTPEGLMATFGSHFTEDQADRFGRTKDHPASQVNIANLAYNGRMGNAADSTDGYRYRGRGPIQLTGRANYLRAGAALGLDLVSSPELVQEPDVGCLVAGWFWAVGNPTGRSLNIPAERLDTGAVTRGINGGNNGLVSRSDLTTRALKALGATA